MNIMIIVELLAPQTQKSMKLKRNVWMNAIIFYLNIIITVMMIVQVILLGYFKIEIYIWKLFQKIII